MSSGGPSRLDKVSLIVQCPPNSAAKVDPPLHDRPMIEPYGRG